MFGAFRSTAVALGGLLWKSPYRMSTHQKSRLRKRMQNIDNTIDLLYKGLKETNQTCKVVERLKTTFPKESEMHPKDKYTVYSKYAKNHRKSVHKVPKWTRLSFRSNPEYF